MKCINCGQELANDMKFCTCCGCPIENSIQSAPFMLSTTNTIPGYKLTMCICSINASVAIIKDNITNTVASLGGTIGSIVDIWKGGHGINNGMVQIYDEVYQAVTERIVEKSKRNGCNAIIGLRYHSQIINDNFYLTAYGTACVVEKE